MEHNRANNCSSTSFSSLRLMLLISINRILIFGFNVKGALFFFFLLLLLLLLSVLLLKFCFVLFLSLLELFSILSNLPSSCGTSSNQTSHFVVLIRRSDSLVPSLFEPLLLVPPLSTKDNNLVAIFNLSIKDIDLEKKKKREKKRNKLIMNKLLCVF